MRYLTKLHLPAAFVCLASILMVMNAQQPAAPAKATPVYMVGLIDIHDRTSYEKYTSGFMAVFSKYNGELLVVEEKPTVMEGEWPFTRTVVIRFPNEADAKRWYDSQEYQELAKLRYAAAKSKIILAKGRM